MRKLKIAALAIGVALSLTACDPPMPASLLVEIAEQTVQCETGDVTVAVPTAAEDLGPIWADAMTASCGDMTFSQVGFDQPADILISGDGAELCTPFARVPFSIDAAVFAVNIADGALVQLNASTIVGILSGKISDWSDPALAELNPDLEMPAGEIKLTKEASAADIAALSQLLEILGESLPAGSLTESKIDPQSTLANLQDGAIALVPFSESIFFGASIASIVTGPDVYVDLVEPTIDTITSAATQWVISNDESAVSVKLDPSIAPTPPEGSDEAPLPYQAIYPIQLQLCGDDNLLSRTVGRFFLRQDQQGVLATSTMVPLNEDLRLAAIEVIAKGLPTPTPATTEPAAE